MKFSQSWCQVVLFAVLFVWATIGGSTVWSDDRNKVADKPAAKAAKEPGDPASEVKKSTTPTRSPRDAKRRLPRYFGKLGLSDAQREKVYGIQAKYETDIDKLEKQLAELKARQDADCRKVLNADQKSQLAEAAEASKARATKADEMEE